MTDRIKLTWAGVWQHHDAGRNDLTVYDSDGNAWRRNPFGIVCDRKAVMA